MKIGIIALGLIGGSILKSLSDKDLEITVISQNKETLEKAKKCSKSVSSDINEVKNCDVIFVCTPINKTLETLDKLENVLSNDCIVTDVSSVKEFVMEKKRPYRFIGSHPMAGTEFSGFDASFKELFVGAKWVLTPDKDTKKEDIETLEKIIKLTGAKTIISEAKGHDLAVALISHMPMLLSQAIFKTATNSELALKLASSGFMDTTRLAMTNTTMAQDMMDYNKDNILEALDLLTNSINLLQSDNYLETISEIKSSRERMYSKEGKNLYE